MASNDYFTITVSVVNNQIQVSPNPAVITEPDTDIKFDLTTSGYRFLDEQTVVVTSPGTQFPDPAQTWDSGVVATLLDVNSAAGEFSYTVYVEPMGGGQLLRHDPTIKNEP